MEQGLMVVLGKAKIFGFYLPSVHLNRKTNEGKIARSKVIGKECEQIAEVICSKIKDDLEEIVRKAF